MPEQVGVMVVDDNAWIGEAIERAVRKHPDLRWAGWVPTTEGLADAAKSRSAQILLLDLDIPGEDSFNALQSLCKEAPGLKVLILSGYLRAELIDRGLQAGAWGYVSKNEDLVEVIDAIRRVAAGEIALSAAVTAEFQRR